MARAGPIILASSTKDPSEILDERPFSWHKSLSALFSLSASTVIYFLNLAYFQFMCAVFWGHYTIGYCFESFDCESLKIPKSIYLESANLQEEKEARELLKKKYEISNSFFEAYYDKIKDLPPAQENSENEESFIWEMKQRKQTYIDYCSQTYGKEAAEKIRNFLKMDDVIVKEINKDVKVKIYRTPMPIPEKKATTQERTSSETDDTNEIQRGPSRFSKSDLFPPDDSDDNDSYTEEYLLDRFTNCKEIDEEATLKRKRFRYYSDESDSE